MSKSEPDQNSAKFSILVADSQILGATHFSDVGLRWCQKELRQVEALYKTPNEAESWSLCGLCAEMANAEAFELYVHQPTYAALMASAQACIICAVILRSLKTVTNYIASSNHPGKISDRSPDDDSIVTESLGSAVSGPLESGEDTNESILLSSVLVDPLNMAKSGSNSSMLDPRVQSFESSGIDRYRRFTVVWKGSGFHWSGDTMGISISTTGEDNSSERFWQRPIWTNLDVNTMDLRQSMIANWLKDCKENHPRCRLAHDAPLPKRVLVLEDSNLPSDHVRLALSESLEGPYAALSYCWGTATHLRTTKESLEAHLRGIPIRDMPKTFQDAIQVCSHLKIKYLWIDSLCIIQGDPTDWNEEAAKMDEIFLNACVTLAAAAGEDSNAGLFHPFVQSVSFHTEDDDTDPPTPVTVSMRLGNFSRQPSSKLHTRGWTFQEDLLSRRYVQFDSKQIRWRCLSEARSEDGLLDGLPVERSLSIPLSSIINPSQQPFRDMYDLWKRVAEDYSRRNLTMETDRLPALAGLSKIFQTLCGDEPFVGLWRNRIIGGLLWSTTDFRSDQTGATGLPSWSWLSSGNTIRYDSFWELFEDDARSMRAEPIARVLSSSLNWSAEPFVSTPTATLVLEGRTAVAKMVTDSTTPTSYTHLCVDGLDDASRPSCDLDQLCDLPMSTVTLLELAIVRNQSKDEEQEPELEPGKCARAMLVLTSTDTPRTYRRIGVTCLEPSPYASLFQDSEERSVCLV